MMLRDRGCCLRRLGLNAVGLGDWGVGVLAGGLEDNLVVGEVEVRDNVIGRGVDSVLRMLRGNHVLVKLDMAGNLIDLASEKELARLLSRNKSLNSKSSLLSQIA
jgi:hypothetical protein